MNRTSANSTPRRRSLQLSLRLRYVLVFVALAVVPLGVAVSVLIDDLSDRARETANRDVQSSLSLRIQAIAGEVQRANRDLVALTRLPEAKELIRHSADTGIPETRIVDPTRLEQVFQAVLETSPDVRRVTVADTGGTELLRLDYSSEQQRVVQRAASAGRLDSEALKRALSVKAGRTYVSNPVVHAQRSGRVDSVTVMLAAPVMDGDKVSAIVTLEVAMPSMLLGQGDALGFFLASAEGKYLLAAGAAASASTGVTGDWPGANLDRAISGDIVHRDGQTLALRAFNVNPGGAPRLWIAGRIENGAGLAAAADDFHNKLVVLGSAVAVIAALLALFAANRVTRPLVLLVEAARRIQAGEGNVRLRPTDLGDLAEVAHSFNGMLDTVVRRTRELVAAKETAETTTRTKSEFLANMSHEIRTPMNGVLGMLELLEQSTLPAAERGFVRTARNSAESLLGVLNDILDFSKIEAGKLQLESIDFDARELVEEVAALLAKQAHAKGIELLCLVPNDLPPRVRGDPTRLRQVLVNLVGNALKFTQKGEVALSVAADAATDRGVALHFEVRDTGIGMSKDTVGRLFSPFTQADSSTTRKYGGTGLGLAITRQLVSLMGGEINVMSEEGQGSSFFFTLSLPIGDGTQRGRLSATTLTGLRVLVVDDNATNRLIVEHHLVSWGVQAVSAAGGWEALGVLRDAEAGGQVFDAILLDYHMPGMDGIDFSRRLQADSVLCRIPRILLSSSGRLNAEEAQGAGLSGSLAKPVRARQLYEAITHALGKEVAPQSAEPKAPVMREKRTARLLLVEDNPVNQKVALVTLRRLGYEVDLAGNGVEALEISARQRYDLIFMDCQMPEMDGFEATRALRKREQEMPLPRTPIVALTANALEGDREQCIAAGMDDYLTKPFKREQLEAILDRWLAVPKAPSKAA